MDVLDLSYRRATTAQGQRKDPMAPPTIKAVVFDFDGLMFNTEEIFNLSGSELLRRRGKEMTPAILSLMMGRRSDEAFPLMIEALGLTEEPAAAAGGGAGHLPRPAVEARRPDAGPVRAAGAHRIAWASQGSGHVVAPALHRIAARAISN